MVESHKVEWFLQSLDFFDCCVENSKLVKREKLVIIHNNYKLLLFTSYCPTLVCTTPATKRAVVMATRVAGEDEGDVKGGKSNGDGNKEGYCKGRGDGKQQ
jgi:hypothetical protein